MTYEATMTHNAQDIRRDGLDFNALVDFANKAFDGKGVLYIGSVMNGCPASIDLENQRVKLLSTSEAAQTGAPLFINVPAPANA